jgi:hypothetical protein
MNAVTHIQVARDGYRKVKICTAVHKYHPFIIKDAMTRIKNPQWQIKG